MALMLIRSPKGGTQIYDTCEGPVKNEEQGRTAYADETGYPATFVSEFRFDVLSLPELSAWLREG